jgi:DNA-binding response OmpR family regulator
VGQAAILVVDDEPDMLDMLTFVLTREGYLVIPASDGHDAIGMLDRADCELVLTDIMMPRMDGVQLASEIRGRAELADVPILALSALPEATVNAMSNDFDVILRKPFMIEDLLGRVRKLVGPRERP